MKFAVKEEIENLQVDDIWSIASEVDITI